MCAPQCGVRWNSRYRNNFLDRGISVFLTICKKFQIAIMIVMRTVKFAIVQLIRLVFTAAHVKCIRLQQTNKKNKFTKGWIFFVLKFNSLRSNAFKIVMVDWRFYSLYCLFILFWLDDTYWQLVALFHN